MPCLSGSTKPRSLENECVCVSSVHAQLAHLERSRAVPLVATVNISLTAKESNKSRHSQNKSNGWHQSFRLYSPQTILQLSKTCFYYHQTSLFQTSFMKVAAVIKLPCADVAAGCGAKKEGHAPGFI